MRHILIAVACAAAACGGEKRENRETANRAPVFPDSITFLSSSALERDGRGAVIGALVTLRTNMRASDPDGDSLVYRWEGTRFNGDALIPMTLDTAYFTARFRTGVIMREPAGAVLRLIATDPRGGVDTAHFCIPGGGFTC